MTTPGICNHWPPKSLLLVHYMQSITCMVDLEGCKWDVHVYGFVVPCSQDCRGNAHGNCLHSKELAVVLVTQISLLRQGRISVLWRTRLWGSIVSVSIVTSRLLL
jgi:hypothetical protein